jgi:hypothetical protein
MEPMPRHQCLIYEGSPAAHLAGLAAVASKELNANSRLIYLNSPTMVAGFRSYLAATGLNVEQEVKREALVLSSEQGHLNNGHFDVDRMLGMLRDALSRALKDGFRSLWASGDMTWELGGERNFDKLLEYECGLEEFLRTNSAIHGICQYHRDTLPADAVATALHTHQAVYINETLSRMNPFYLGTDALGQKRPSVSATKAQDLFVRLNRPLNS